jgi:C-terminal processing protease CtpA/Prc
MRNTFAALHDLKTLGTAIKSAEDNLNAYLSSSRARTQMTFDVWKVAIEKTKVAITRAKEFWRTQTSRMGYLQISEFEQNAIETAVNALANELIKINNNTGGNRDTLVALADHLNKRLDIADTRGKVQTGLKIGLPVVGVGLLLYLAMAK